MKIWSINNFPTAAGLASSASGLAAQTQCLSTVFKIDKYRESELARLGSGSACRSIYGGIVEWSGPPKSYLD